MPISIDWGTKVITVPQSYLTFISGTLYELDTNQMRLDLKALEASEDGMPFPDTHVHNTEVAVAGVSYARFVEILKPYTVQFEDLGHPGYTVRLAGSNNNVFEEGIIITNHNSVIGQNAAGLISVDIPTQETAAHLTVAYTGTTIDIGIWLLRLGSTVMNPTSAQIDWYSPNGSLLFTDSDSSPDARGHFNLSKVQALADNTAYYAVLTVTDGQGSVVTRRGVPTVATV